MGVIVVVLAVLLLVSVLVSVLLLSLAFVSVFVPVRGLVSAGCSVPETPSTSLARPRAAYG